jgi:cytoskeletal protein CcmA (bactofilin family)
MDDHAQYSDGETFVNSIIGEGTTVHGDFELNGLLRIDGTLFGSVRTTGKVLIGKNGTSECDIVARTVVVGGKFTGNIIATEKITLLSTGEVVGTIKTPRLVVEEGVLFNGSCEIIEDKKRLEDVKRQVFSVYRQNEQRPDAPAEESVSTGVPAYTRAQVEQVT